jgi:plasmid stabilization system protein ParE
MQVIWLPEAFEDLLGIRKYIEEYDPGAAQRIAQRILTAVGPLGKFTEMGRPGRVLGTRELVVFGTPYIIPYRVKGDTIEILGVVHGAEKWPDKF